MEAEWDPAKARSNLAKHGFSFFDAEEFMKDEYDFSKGKQGPILSSKGKTRITIYIDDDILEAYRVFGDESGRGYQTLINAALRETIKPGPKPLDAKTLRRILREELRKFAAAQL